MSVVIPIKYISSKTVLVLYMATRQKFLDHLRQCYCPYCRGWFTRRIIT